MKRVKPALALVMGGVMALGATSCGSSETTTTADANATGENKEPVTLNIFQFKVEINDQLNAAIDTYEALNPHVTINLETVGGGDDYGAALKAKFTNETTIFNVGGPQDVKDWLPKLEDLSDQPWVANAAAGTLEGVTVDGKVYGLPYAIEGYGLIYNKAIFEACGINGDDIDTYQELEDSFKTIQAKIDSGELKDQFPELEAVTELPAKETWITGLHASNAFLNQEFDSTLDSFASETVDFTYGDAFKKYIDLMADYSSNSDTRGNLNAVDYATQVGGGLGIGRVAVIQQGNWIYGEVASIDPEVAENLGILPIPVQGAVEDSIPTGVPMYWAINNEAPEAAKEEAKNFLNWLYQSDEGKNIVVNEFGFIPPFTNYDGIEPQDSLGRAVKAYSDAGKTTPWVFMGYPTDWGMNVLGAKIQGYLDGSLTWEQVITESKEQWTATR